jgi:hypothetical protein
VRGDLQRARATLDSRLPAPRERAPLPRSARERELLGRFAEAFETGDVDRVVELMTDDALLTMPPEPLEYQGLEAINAFLSNRFRVDDVRGVRLVPTRANDQPAFGHYARSARVDRAVLRRIVLTLEGDTISALTRFGDSAILPHFGLPRTLRA